ncbi:T9SS type A sorting domain-containing protein [Aureisphaera sp. CAU 1614]|uniref:T9SS type A sorting domain-containing protein n=1 Tax=Halomarinibacterium sedimenti TaxID=2857106 RepID=A0A9X1JWF8_9FLAO|nr:T9SS type A sorting domain-containing protein [Halomarinibacterium sedimenti]MBW2938795.1 T9SS type A sorting domain-containing protein [Halomarinibacterium sedimenti]
MIRFLSLIAVVALISCDSSTEKNSKQLEEKYPHDFMFMQRAYPTGQIKTEAYKEAIQWKKQQTRNAGGIWEFVGPTNIGGRVTDIEIPIDQPQTYYVGAASGGIFKTTDAGATWNPIFDDQEMLSIGDIEISKNNADLIWVGTGEVNAGGGSLAYDGDGIYKSEDGGTTWEVKGLPDIGSISKIALDPNDDNTIFVGGMGPLFRNDTNRGVYRSTDGGDTWEQKLFVSDSTGIIDMVIHPSNGDIVYAASWERIRRPQYRQYGGETSRIYRSTDGGENWTELTNGLPSGPSDKGRISIAISQSNPSVLYARYTDAIGSIQGVYRTADGGDSWTTMNAAPLNNVGFHWWFRGIVVDPIDENIIYNVDFVVQKSLDGGATWSDTFDNVHVDQHALAFNTSVPGEVLLGNDGGFYKSANDGDSWVKDETLPITQFYRIYPENDDRIYGGAQDNSTMRTLTGSSNDWEIIYGGDGFQPLVDPNDSNIIYALSQYGNIGKSINGGASFFGATNGISGGDRKNWDTPIIFDPQDSQILYTGTQRVYKTTNGAGNWTAISPDLTNGAGGGNLNFGTIISIDVSSQDSNLIYVGTDDGNVWRTDDGGTNWINLSSSLPDRWVTKVESMPDFGNVDEVFVSFSGYRYGEDLGHVFYSNDRGNTWQDITTNLPDIPVNDLEFGGSFVTGLYLATDIGVYFSSFPGNDWFQWGDDLPSVPVTDISFENGNQKFGSYLYAGTYGRSIYKSFVGEAGIEDFSANNVSLFPNPALEHVTIQSKFSIDGVVTIYNQLGRKVLSETISGTEKTLTLSNLPAGLYFVTISSENRKVTKKLIVK